MCVCVACYVLVYAHDVSWLMRPEQFVQYELICYHICLLLCKLVSSQYWNAHAIDLCMHHMFCIHAIEPFPPGDDWISDKHNYPTIKWWSRSGRTFLNIRNDYIMLITVTYKMCWDFVSIGNQSATGWNENCNNLVYMLARFCVYHDSVTYGWSRPCKFN